MATMDSSKTRGSSQGLLRSPVSPPTSPLPPVSPEGKAKVDTLIDQLNCLDLPEDLSVSKDQVDYIKQCFHTACMDGETLKYVVEKLHQVCLSNKSIIAKVAASLNVVSEFEIESVKLRSALLSCLQSDFENRHEIQAKSPKQFINAVALLGEIYARVRIGKYPISALSVPVLEYLEALLTGDESEIEMFSHLLILISETLREGLKATSDGHRPSLTMSSPFQNLLLKVRSTLMSRNLSSQSRLWLLFVMDLTSSGDFRAPSSSLQLYYKEEDHLGSEAEALLKSIQLSDKSIAYEASSPEYFGIKAGEVIDTDRIAQISISPKGKDRESSDKTGNVGWKKGSHEKGGNADKRENFRSAFKVDNNTSKGGKSYWLHDDRFETEEKSSGFKGGFQKTRVCEDDWRRPPNVKGETESRSRGNGPEEKSSGFKGGFQNSRVCEDDWRRPPNVKGETESRSRGNGGSRRQSETNKVVTEEREHMTASSARPAVSKCVDILAGYVDQESWE